MSTANRLVFSIYGHEKVNFEQHVMFTATIRHKMYQLVSKVLTFKKHPIEKPKYPQKYLFEMLNTQLTFAIPK